MPIFPAQYSTLSAKALKKDIENCYGWQKVKCRFHMHGVSDTYIIESSKGKNIFRIYRTSHRTLDEIKAEIELLLHLKKKGRGVAAPVTDSGGSYIQEFEAAEGIRYGVMFAYADGKSPMEMDSSQYAIVGKELGLLHLEMGAIKLKYPRKRYSIETMIEDPVKRLKPAFKEFPEGHRFLKKTGEAVSEKLLALNPSKFAYGYCHTDVHLKNLHFNEANVMTLFDFDFFGEGWLVNDLAGFHCHYMWHRPLEGEESSWNAFLTAYRSVRPLSAEEEAAIPYLGFAWWTFYLGFQFEAFDDWSNTFFNERYLRHRIALMKDYTDKYCKL
jgi:Ser/Thr protein kinase RdoA (MazF antagonist)